MFLTFVRNNNRIISDSPCRKHSYNRLASFGKDTPRPPIIQKSFAIGSQLGSFIRFHRHLPFSSDLGPVDSTNEFFQGNSIDHMDAWRLGNRCWLTLHELKVDSLFHREYRNRDSTTP